MNEIKQPSRKRTIAYYLTVLLVVMLLNSMLMPALTRRTIKEVDYGTFMTMTEQKEISEVDIRSGRTVCMRRGLPSPAGLWSRPRRLSALF